MPGLRRVTATINGTNITLLSSGYLARALGRTGWTVRHWIKLGLLPPAPFVISPDVPRTRRPLYPEQYLDALTEIAWRLRIGSRMDYANRRSFHAEVARAYEEIVVPLLPFGDSTARSPTGPEPRNPRWRRGYTLRNAIGKNDGFGLTRKRPSHKLTGIGRFTHLYSESRYLGEWQPPRASLPCAVATLTLRAACRSSRWAYRDNSQSIPLPSTLRMALHVCYP